LLYLEQVHHVHEVILILFNFSLLNLNLLYLEQVQQVREGSGRTRKFVAGLSRSVFVTFYEREAAARALSVSFFSFYFFIV
jgi:hypothetical protein